MASTSKENSREYQVALSFAGEDRQFVSCVAKLLKEAGITVFYDEYEQVSLWGRDLYSHLSEVYSAKAEYCVVFISKFYEEKLWTRHELKSAQARAFSENSDYILPFRLDDTEIKGILPTQGYLSKKDYDCNSLADAIIKKVGIQAAIINKSDSTDDEPVKVEDGITMHKNGDFEITISKSELWGNRLANAFPGCRGLQWFDQPKEIVERLGILLKSPLTFQLFPNKVVNHIKTVVFWWFRGYSSMHIEKFQALSNEKFLLDRYEYLVERIGVYRNDDPRRDFIYIKVKGEESIVKSYDSAYSIKQQLKSKAYATEEYGIYKDNVVTREEYDDGAAIINGKVTSFSSSAELRVRYLTPYNFIICPQSSIHNSRNADIFWRSLLDKILETGNDKLLEENLDEIDNLKEEFSYTLDWYSSKNHES